MLNRAGIILLEQYVAFLLPYSYIQHYSKFPSQIPKANDNSNIYLIQRCQWLCLCDPQIYVVHTNYHEDRICSHHRRQQIVTWGSDQEITVDVYGGDAAEV